MTEQGFENRKTLEIDWKGQKAKVVIKELSFGDRARI